MTHFVADPEPHDYWVPAIGMTMSIPSRNGKAKINVWHPGSADVTLQVQSGHPRFKFYSTKGKQHKIDLRRFIVEGLAAGDQIAVFDQSGGPTVSTHRSRISIDPFGLDSSNYPMHGSEFIEKVDKSIGMILSNPVGRLILDAVPGSVVIFFTEGSGIVTASSVYGPTSQKVVAVESTYLRGSKGPGARLDEVILHEFAHHADNTRNYVDIGDGLQFDAREFFSVTGTNVYSSIYHRPLRKDHVGFTPMPPLYQGSAGEAKFSHAHAANFAKVKSAIGPTLYNALVFADAPWNPFP
jgi:hypothetical protein